MWPHLAQRRRWNHQPPVARHSTQPAPDGGTEGSIWSLADIRLIIAIDADPARPARSRGRALPRYFSGAAAIAWAIAVSQITTV